MKTKLAAVFTGVALLGGGGIAHAADVAARTDTTDTQVITLTDTQMEKVTAGHLDIAEFPWTHNGKHYVKGRAWFGIWENWVVKVGPHQDCGSRPCQDYLYK